jgi:hypothetical protein
MKIVCLGLLIEILFLLPNISFASQDDFCSGSNQLYPPPEGIIITSYDKVDMIVKSHELWLKKYNKILIESGSSDLEAMSYPHRANLSNLDLSYIDYDFKGLDLSYAILEGSSLENLDFSNSILNHAKLNDAFLKNTKMRNTKLNHAELRSACLRQTDLTYSELNKADLTGAQLSWTLLSGTALTEAILTNVRFDIDVYIGYLPHVISISQAKGLETLTFLSPTPAIALRNAFRDQGLKKQERMLTYDIKRPLNNDYGKIEGLLHSMLFDYTCKYGMKPLLPLLWVIILAAWCSTIYMFALCRGNANSKNAIIVIWDEHSFDQNECLWPQRTPINYRFFFPNIQRRLTGKPIQLLSIFCGGLYFSLLSALHIGWRDLNVGTWICRIQPREYNLRAVGWIRFISGLQSLISVYLIALSILTYFGHPFG